MSSRPSSFSGGGGYLNEVDAIIVGYTFDVGETKKMQSGKNKGKNFTPLSLIPEFQVDGEEETKTRRLLIDDAEKFGDVSKDGLTLETPAGQNIWKKSEAGVFMASLIAPTDGGEGFPDDQFSDDPDAINFEPMIGTRVRLVLEVNPDKKEETNKETGKKYPGRDLKVQTVYDLPEADHKANGKAKSAASAKGAKGAKGKTKEPDVDIDAETSEFILEMLNDAKDGTLAKSKLSMGILKKRMKHPNRDEIKERAFDDSFLASGDGWSYNKKKQELTLDA